MTEPAATDLELLRQAIDLGKQSPAGHTYAVGAVIADAAGAVISTGYSRESDPLEHAEEAALAKLTQDDPRLAGATMYSSLEPCSVRSSRPRTCTQLIIAAGIPRVVFAWREPELTVDCQGAELLADAGLDVVEVPELAPLVQQTNAELLDRLADG